MTIYVGRSINLYAVNAQNGAVKWSVNLNDEIFTSPLLYQGMIYVATSYSQGLILHAVDTTGKQQWSSTISTQSDVAESDVYASSGLIFLCSQFTPPVAVDAMTGAIRWTFPSASLNPQSNGGGNISLNQGELYFINGTSLFAIDPPTGNILWEIDNQTSTLPAVTSDKVFLAWQNYTVAAFDRQTAAQLWSQPGNPNAYPSVEAVSVNTYFGNLYIFQGGRCR